MADATATTDAEQPKGSDFAWLKSYPDHVAWDMELKGEPVFAMLNRAVAAYPDRPFSHFLGRTMTYRELGRDVERAVAGLRAIGIGQGSRVGLMLPNCPTFIVHYYAALKLGATVVNYNPLYTVEELAGQIRDSGTDVLVTLDLKVLFDKVEDLLADGTLPAAVVGSFVSLLPSTKGVLFRMFKAKELAHPERSEHAAKITLESSFQTPDAPISDANIDPETDIAVLQYTGGTTGLPKGAMLTHANLTINTQQVVAWAPDMGDDPDRVLAVLPFFHVFAMTVVMNYAIATGAEIVMMPRFNLDDALKLIDKTRPSVLPGVPTLYNAMINHPKLDSHDLTSLKFCISGGAALPVEVKKQFEKLTGCHLVEGYGLSETSPVAACNPPGLASDAKPASIGLPLPGTRLSLRALDDPTHEVALGEKGEICIAGPQVMKGYWNNADATGGSFVGDYFRTGDVAVMDDDGFFFIVDRIKDLIISSGYNIYPRKIEDAIYEFEPVEEVTVIGIPDDYRGEVPKAFVKLRDGQTATAEELMAFLESKLSKLELPAKVVFRDELPKTMIGKLSKKELRDEVDD